MHTVHLALRHQDPAGARGLFAKLIRMRLVTAYPHAGVSIGASMYHSTLARGVHHDAVNAAGWLLVSTPVAYEVAMARIQRRMGTRYDWISLLAFLVPFRITWSKADYCYEFVWFVLTGEVHKGPVTPESLLALVAQLNAEHNKD
jgi:hypothetical protein